MKYPLRILAVTSTLFCQLAGAELSERSKLVFALSQSNLNTGVELAIECFRTKAVDAQGKEAFDVSKVATIDYFNNEEYCQSYRQFIAQIRHSGSLPKGFVYRGQ